jgi:hypothetical protein
MIIKFVSNSSVRKTGFRATPFANGWSIQKREKLQYSVKHDDEEIIEFSCKNGQRQTTIDNDTRQKVMTQDIKVI